MIKDEDYTDKSKEEEQVLKGVSWMFKKIIRIIYIFLKKLLTNNK